MRCRGLFFFERQLGAPVKAPSVLDHAIVETIQFQRWEHTSRAFLPARLAAKRAPTAHWPATIPSFSNDVAGRSSLQPAGSSHVLTVDGSLGEGGGQIVRSSLALSLVTGTPFRMIRIRNNRRRPGLRQQHLTAVRAAAMIADAEVVGDAIGSRELTFRPRRPKGGEYEFAIGTAGSTTLVIQTILPVLALVPNRTSLVLEGGTHNPGAPPFDFLARVYLPLLERMGPTVRAVLERPGFFPAGGGRCAISIEPVESLEPFHLLERGLIRKRRVSARVAHLPCHIAEREITVLTESLRWDPSCFHVEELTDVDGPGNVVIVELTAEHVTEVFSAFGRKGLRAEVLAKRLGGEVLEYLRAEVPVGRHLADQLVLLLAIAGGGSFTTLAPSSHLTTQVEVIRQFLGLRVHLSEHDKGRWLVEVLHRNPSSPTVSLRDRD